MRLFRDFTSRNDRRTKSIFEKNLIVKIILIVFVFVSISNSIVIAKGGKAKMKTLIVYYSLTGNTEIAAKEIAKKYNADLVKLEDLKQRLKFVLYVYGSYCALKDKVWDIKSIDINLKDYSRVFVGSPVWAGSPVPAINTFLTNANFTGKEVIPFVTMGGRNPSKSIPKMSSKIISRGGRIAGSFAIQTGRKKPEEVSAKAKEEILKFVK